MGLAQDAPVTVAPAVLEPVSPEYPEVARDLNIEGRVTLHIDVDVDGSVIEARVAEGVHSALDEAALAAARKLSFSPGTVDGEPTALTIAYQYVFNLATIDDEGGQDPATLHGTVDDAEGEGVPEAKVELTCAGQEPRTYRANSRGRFTAAFLPPCEWSVGVSGSGFAPSAYKVSLEAGEIHTAAFTLVEEDAMVVVVFADRETWREVSKGSREPDTGTVTGVYELTRADMEGTPGSMDDITRATHALPGVVSDGDMLAGFHVRGGEQSDVVYMLDGVPLENPFHLAGFNSIFNPDMVQRVSFFSGAPPANVPAATSAVMAVETWDGQPREEGGGIDGAVDVSGSGIRLLLLGPLDREGKVTVALAARRTWLEAYFAVMKAANVIDTAFAAPEYNELSARISWRPNDKSQYILTVMRTGDSLVIVDSEDESLINVSGSFELRNRLFLTSVASTWELGGSTKLSNTAAYIQDRSSQERDLVGNTSQLTFMDRIFNRTDLVHEAGKHTVSLGVDGSYFIVDNQGEIEDKRPVPTWAQVGLADLGLPLIDVDLERSWMEGNAYAQWEFDSPVKLRAGLRATYAGLSEDVLLSPRAGLSVPLPTATIPKVSLGQYYKIFRDPFVLDPVTGNPNLDPERARHLIFGVDQGIPLPGEEAGMLLRVEGYQIWLDSLVVSPDSQAGVDAGGTYANLGTGRNSGVDFMAAFKTGRWSGQLAYGLLFAKRVNPANDVFAEEIAPAQDQRHTVRVMADWKATPHWQFTAQGSYHTGRPISSVVVATEDTVAIDCLNCDRLAPVVNFDLRAEWHRAYRFYRLTFYAELLNTGNIQSPFLPIYNVVDGEVEESVLKHLPMRPFIGLRLDY